MENQEMTILEQCLIDSKLENTEFGPTCALEFNNQNRGRKKLVIRTTLIPGLISKLENVLNFEILQEIKVEQQMLKNEMAKLEEISAECAKLHDMALYLLKEATEKKQN